MGDLNYGEGGGRLEGCKGCDGCERLISTKEGKEVRIMGNVYIYGECSRCEKLTDAEFTFIVHGSRALTELTRLEGANMPVGKIAAHYCGYCGGYVPLEEDKCSCGNFDPQGWNYKEGDKRHWKGGGEKRCQ